MPNVDWMIFGGGLISKHVFEEARHCFLYGQFLAAIVMGLSFIEISLGAAFYGIGRNDLERAGIAELAEEALKMEWITKEDFEAIERIRVYRNPVTHFRRPGHDSRIETRAFMHGFLPYEIIEKDARHVIQTVFHLLLKIVPRAKSSAK